jgi:hypothetical protein
MIHLNYGSVIQVSSPDSHKSNDVSSSITYRELTKKRGNAYRGDLYRIRSEDSITNSRGR